MVSLTRKELELMAKPYIFLLNGPPGAGKDTAAAYLSEKVPDASLVKFAAPIKQAARALYGAMEFAAHDTFELKNEPAAAFYGKSCRQVQISISEDFMKPFHGTDIFGRMLARTISQENRQRGVSNFFVSDSGFESEAKVLIDTFGADSVFLFRIHRDGHSFTGDSRNYIDLAEFGVQQFDVNNVGTPEQFGQKIHQIISDITNHRLGAN